MIAVAPSTRASEAGRINRTPAVLHIGVKGGTDLGNAETASVAVTLRAVLSRIADAARQITAGANDLFGPEPVVLRCISPLGRAAERIVAREALAVGFKLQVPLPDPHASVTTTFPDERSRLDFEDLLAAAEVVVTLERDPGQADAVEQAVLGVVVDQSDILLVVGDTDDDESKRLMREVQARNVPVVAIGANTPHAVRIIATGPAGDWQDELCAMVATILDPFRAVDPSAQAALRTVPHRYFGERSPSIRWYSHLHTLFERAVLTGWRAPARNPVQRNASDFFVPDDTFAREFSRVDMLAIRYAHLYRSAFVSRYLLILPMAIGLVMGFFAATAAVRTIGFGIQWFAVVGTLVLYHLGKRIGWHERFTTYRYLAELLRHQLYLGRLGRTLPTAYYPADKDSATAVWVLWQFRSIVRQIGLRAMDQGSVDCRQMARTMRAFLGEQCDFYRQSAARYGTISERIWRFAIGLFWLDFVIITLRGGVIGFMRTAGWSSDPTIGAVLDWWEDFLNELDIVLPSLAWIILALGDQGEYSRLSERYAGMGEQAAALVAELDRTEPTYPALVRLAIDAAAALTSEVAGWRLLLSARIITYL
jgi:hypothetical protein